MPGLNKFNEWRDVQQAGSLFYGQALELHWDISKNKNKMCFSQYLQERVEYCCTPLSGCK